MKNIQLWSTLITMIVCMAVGVLISTYFLAEGLSLGRIYLVDLAAFGGFSYGFIQFTNLLWRLLKL